MLEPMPEPTPAAVGWSPSTPWSHCATRGRLVLETLNLRPKQRDAFQRWEGSALSQSLHAPPDASPRGTLHKTQATRA